MTSLDNRICLITGAGSGIGAEIARQFHAEGATLILTDINTDTVKAVASELGGKNIYVFAHDTSSEDDWRRVVIEAGKVAPRIDVLVNNAGFGTVGMIVDTTLEEWRRIMAVNCDGVFLGMKHVLPVMGDAGSIINLSSILGKVGAAGCSAYSAAKGAVALMSKCAALECAEDPRKIRVNSLHPGYIATPAFNNMPVEVQDAARALHPVGRVGEPVEIAKAAVFLASDASSFMTGSEMFVDGGYTTR